MNLEKKLRYWQKVLRLQDWTITVSEVGLAGLNAPGSHIAETRVDEYHKTAEIKVLSNQENTSRFVDQEVSLVHELLHITLTRLEGPEMDVEQSINLLAMALVGLERK